MKPSRRRVLGGTIALFSARYLPKIAPKIWKKRVLTVYYDKVTRSLRAIDKIVD